MDQMENKFLLFIGILIVCLIMLLFFTNSKPKPQSGYKCFLDDEGKHHCLKVDHAPDAILGIFSTQEECVHFCGSN